MLKSVSELIAEVAGRVESISMEDALKIENVLIVDTREPPEAAQRPIACSTNIPRGVLEMKITELTQDPATPICVHCASGHRAVLAAEQLMRLGFTNVKAISSGIDHICLVVGD
jgi:rhodanese-related sulfurtransferase